MPDAALTWAFVDESGDIGYAPTSSRYLIVAAVLTSRPELLRKAAAKTRKSLGKRLRDIPELKAQRTPRKVVLRLLSRVIELEVEIVAVVVDKSAFRQAALSEDLYRFACAELVAHCTNYHSKLKLICDRRYTNPQLRSQLEYYVLERLKRASATREVAIEMAHLDSAQDGGLQVADAIAWGIAQRYERGDSEFYDLIRRRVHAGLLINKSKNGLPLEADSHRFTMKTA